MPGEKRPREEEIPTLYSYWRSSASWRVRIVIAYKSHGHQTIVGLSGSNVHGADIVYRYRAVNLLKGEENNAEYLKVNPAGVIPTMVFPGHDKTHPLVLGQSMAIMEYLEDMYGPEKGYLSLFPSTTGKTSAQIASDRAHVRSISMHIVSGIHPIQNIGVLLRVEKFVKSNIAKTNASNADIVEGTALRTAWGKETIATGLEELEALLCNLLTPEKRLLFGNWTDTAAITDYVEGKGDRSLRFYCFGDSFTLADCCLVPQLYNAARFGVTLLRKREGDNHTPLIACIQASLLHHHKSVMDSAHPDSMPDAQK